MIGAGLCLAGLGGPARMTVYVDDVVHVRQARQRRDVSSLPGWRPHCHAVQGLRLSGEVHIRHAQEEVLMWFDWVARQCQ